MVLIHPVPLYARHYRKVASVALTYLIMATVSICYASNIRSSEITFDQFDVGKTDMSGPSSSINNIIGAAITLFQMFCVGIAVIIVVVSFLGLFLCCTV